MLGYPFREHHAPGNALCIDGGRDRRDDPRDGAVYEETVYDLLHHLAYRSGSRVGNAIVIGIVAHAAGHANRGVRIFTPRRAIGDSITTFLDGSSDPTARGAEPLSRPGRGAQGFIAYFPFEWPAIGSGRPGEARDEVLLHELVHAYMGQRGLSSPRELRGAGVPNRVRDFDIVDDFFSVMVTNVYASELHRPARRDHGDFFELQRSAADVRNDLAFAPFFRGLARAAPELVRELELIDTPFNPWRVRPARAA